MMMVSTQESNAVEGVSSQIKIPCLQVTHEASMCGASMEPTCALSTSEDGKVKSPLQLFKTCTNSCPARSKSVVHAIRSIRRCAVTRKSDSVFDEPLLLRWYERSCVHPTTSRVMLKCKSTSISSEPSQLYSIM